MKFAGTKSLFRMIPLLALLISLIGGAISVSPVHAASLTVTTDADTIAVDGFCSLREAITNANNDAATNTDCTAGSGTDTITFAGDYTITLSLGTLSLSSPMTIDGTGHTVTIDAIHSSRVFSTSSTVTLDNLTMTNGNGDGGVGGGILVTSGTLTIQHSTVSNNDASSYGGGIYITFGAS